MRLKSTRLVGFKSFVDPTTANFPSNMTAVVGPNGCGKSNIIDAVRWVMGESSAKHLRGESMADVIFNGSNARKPVAQASIELVFDNSEGKIGGEYAGYNEISVKRQVTRDGHSGYFLNGTRCRRKDITDLFLGTGLGSRSYAIIEQGMISRLIEAKPQELRVYVEEAAGISKYKERRRETENRMRRTRENLERLTDIREELDRQLERLSRQASAAEKYKQYKEEERQKSASLRALRWRLLNDQLERLEESLREREVELEARNAERQGEEAELERLRERHGEVQERVDQAQQAFYETGAEVARLEQSIQHERERREQLNDNLESVTRNWRESSEHLAEDRQRITELEERLAEQEPVLDAARRRDELAAAALAEADEAMQQWQQEWEAFNERASGSRRAAEVEQSRIQHLEQSSERLAERIERLQKEQAGLDSGPVAAETRELEEQTAELRQQLEQVEREGERLQGEMSELREGNAERARVLDELREEKQRLSSRHASLEALQKAAMGDDGSVSEWLARHGLDSNERLADRLRVEPGWERAVETVLGDALQGVCVEGLEEVEQWLEDLEHGRVCLLTPDAAPQEEALAPMLSERVSGPVPACMVGVHAVETLGEALALRGKLAPGQSVVTRDGIHLGPDWLQVVRERDREAGILERRRELEEIDGELAGLAERMGEEQERLDEGRERLASLDEQREQARQRGSALHHELGEVNARLSARQVRLEQMSARQERLGRELSESREQREQEQEQLREARAALAESLDAMEHDKEEQEQLLSRRDECRGRLDEARREAREARDQAHHTEMEVQSARTQLESLREGLVRLDDRVRSLAERKEELESQLQQDNEPGLELREQLESRLAERQEREARLGEVRRELETIEHDMRAREHKRQEAERQAGEVRDLVQQQRMEWQEIKVRRNTIHEQLVEQNFEPEELVRQLPEDADEGRWSEELEQLAQRIQRLGQINLAAIDEYKSQQERKAYLDQQNEDLEDALRTLENAIRRIDRETRTRFREYFERINQGVQELFPKVFGGGHASLEMTGDDLLDTGVAIVARPPGKRNSSIHQLSGGEKALTALSLVFAIFQLNPAPFCLLDEVDAPLDDANVTRFCNLVREMSEKVQFIYITHNKITMEMAETLMGVTMHEPGVSRLVSVDVDEAAEMAAG